MHVVFSDPGTSEKTEETKSLFNSNEQRSKKRKTLYNCIWNQILSETPT